MTGISPSLSYNGREQVYRCQLHGAFLCHVLVCGGPVLSITDSSGAPGSEFRQVAPGSFGHFVYGHLPAQYLLGDVENRGCVVRRSCHFLHQCPFKPRPSFAIRGLQEYQPCAHDRQLAKAFPESTAVGLGAVLPLADQEFGDALEVCIARILDPIPQDDRLSFSIRLVVHEISVPSDGRGEVVYAPRFSPKWPRMTGPYSALLNIMYVVCLMVARFTSGTTAMLSSSFSKSPPLRGGAPGCMVTEKDRNVIFGRVLCYGHVSENQQLLDDDVADGIFPASQLSQRSFFTRHSPRIKS